MLFTWLSYAQSTFVGLSCNTQHLFGLSCNVIHVISRLMPKRTREYLDGCCCLLLFVCLKHNILQLSKLYIYTWRNQSTKAFLEIFPCLFLLFLYSNYHSPTTQGKEKEKVSASSAPHKYSIIFNSMLLSVLSTVVVHELAKYIKDFSMTFY